MSEYTGFEDTAPSEHQFQKTFTFRGKPLAKYSFGHRAALIRIGQGTRLPRYEQAIYLVFILTKPHTYADSIREDEQISAFRIDAGKWAEENNVVEDAGWAEIHALAESIENPVIEAQSIEPVSEALPVAGKPKKAVAGKG